MAILQKMQFGMRGIILVLKQKVKDIPHRICCVICKGVVQANYVDHGVLPQNETYKIMSLVRLLVFLILLLASPRPLLAGQFDPASNIERLNKAIQTYKELGKKDPWPVIPKGEKIEPQAEDERIPLIRKRLEAEGYIKKSSDEKIYDEKLVEAIKLYQVRNGMEPDGGIGKGTVAAMHIPV